MEKKQHYCLINSLSRLVSNKLTKHHGSLNICRRCLNLFPNSQKLKIHKEYCSNNETVKIEMPKEGSCVSFVHHNRSVRVPFVVYVDFEAFNNTNQVDFASRLFVLINVSIKNQFSSGQRVKMKTSAQFLLKCLSKR